MFKHLSTQRQITQAKNLGNLISPMNIFAFALLFCPVANLTLLNTMTFQILYTLGQLIYVCPLALKAYIL